MLTVNHWKQYVHLFFAALSGGKLRKITFMAFSDLLELPMRWKMLPIVTTPQAAAAAASIRIHRFIPLIDE